MMKLSIVIPIFNLEGYILTVLESLCNQTLSTEKYEVIIVDDGSTDNTRDVLHDFLKGETLNFKYYFKRNGGVSSARNMGLDLTEGEWVYFLDGDDYISSDFLENVMLSIEDNSPDLIITNYKKDVCGKIIDVKTNLRIDIAREEFITLYLNGEVMCNICTLIFRKDLIEKVGLKFDEVTKYGEDLEFYQKFLFSIDTIKIIPQVNFFYVNRKSSAVNSKVGIAREESLIALNRVRDTIRKSERNKIFLTTYDSIYYPTRILRIFYKLIEEGSYSVAKELIKSRKYNFSLKNSNLTGKAKLKVLLLRFFPRLYIGILIALYYRRWNEH